MISLVSSLALLPSVLRSSAFAQTNIKPQVRPLPALPLQSTKSSRAATGSKKKTPRPQPTPQPAQPAPLPPLPPPLAEQSLPYPLRYIDRPFTIPKGMYDILFTFSVTNMESTKQQFELLGYLSEFQVRQPLTNDFNLLWKPLPLGIHYQPKRSETTVSGVGWNLGWMFQGNLGYKPEFISYLRHTLDAKTAIEMDLNYFTFIPFKAFPSIWSGTFRIGPIFQQSERLAVSPRFGMTLENVLRARLYQPGRTHFETRVTSESARVTFPYSLWVNYAVSPALDVSFEYSVLGSGFREETSVQLATLGITGHW